MSNIRRYHLENTPIKGDAQDHNQLGNEPLPIPLGYQTEAGGQF